MTNLDNPTPRLLRRISSLGLGLRAATFDVRDVAGRYDDRQCRRAAISVVRAQVLSASNARRLARDQDALQHLFALRDVMFVRPGHDERQRDATAVHQPVPLAPPFFLDPSGWVRGTVAPGAP